MPLDPASAPFLPAFVTEVREIHARCTRTLVSLEHGSAEAAGTGIRAIARGLHTIKGSAATLGLDEIAELAHGLEGVLGENSAGLVPDRADLLLAGLDALLERSAAHAEGRSDGPSGLEKVLARLGTRSSGPAATPASEPRGQSRPPSKREEAPAEALLLRVEAGAVTELLREVEQARELRGRLEAGRRALDLQLLHKGDLERSDLLGLLLEAGRSFSREAEAAGDLVEALETGLKAIATLPVNAVVEPLHRTVRDLCRQLGKEARLSVTGGELSVDRTVLEALRGPLVHLVRNAIDHGIEAPHVRERRGKHRSGALVIRAEKQGNLLRLEVGDDGEGIDPARVREAALRRGLLAPDALAALDDAAAVQLVFAPGFSTRDAVTAVSGRGVGLDEVQAKVRALGGQLDLRNSPGAGIRFVLTVPIGYGSSPILLVRCGDERLGVPSASVEGLVLLRRDQLTQGSAQVELQYRGTLVPVGDLGARLQLREALPVEAGQSVVVLVSQGQRLALRVDVIEGERDLVIRPLPRALQRLAAYQGAVSTPEGDLVLVLAPEWLFETSDVAPEAVRARRALVVDDSLTARALLRNALEAGRYAVHAAASGEQALALLDRGQYDVVICDLGMSGMGGLGFTAAVRTHPLRAQLPIILVTGDDGEAARRQGLAAGADGFLSKRDCTSGRLLSEVAAVLSRSARHP
jgi:two-component system chemotaxis sensor kinase CheA